jgi:hypothetical protein
MDANLREIIVEMKDGRKERTTGQEVTEAHLEMEPNSGEKEAETERQENPNEEVAFHSLMACRNVRTACQEVTEVNPEKTEPTNDSIAILKKMETTDLTANPEEMECESGHSDVPTEDAVIKALKGGKKRHRDQHVAAGRRRERKELIRGDSGSRRKLCAACRKVSLRASVARRKGNFLQENSNPGKLWTAKGISRSRQKDDPLCRVAWRKGQNKDDVTPRSPKERTLGKIHIL